LTVRTGQLGQDNSDRTLQKGQQGQENPDRTIVAGLSWVNGYSGKINVINPDDDAIVQKDDNINVITQSDDITK
jgi:hypothetical protein